MKPRKMEQYIAEGKRLADVVAAHRAARGEASAEVPSAQTGSPEPDCNKRKSYRLPPLATPTPIPGYPLNPSPAEVPDYGTMGRVKAIKARQRSRKIDPIGPPELVKAREASIDPSRIERHDVRTWKVAE